MLLDTLQCTGRPPTKDYLVPNVNSADIEKPWSRGWRSWLNPGGSRPGGCSLVLVSRPEEGACTCPVLQAQRSAEGPFPGIAVTHPSPNHLS